jgi:hypothetical protein
MTLQTQGGMVGAVAVDLPHMLRAAPNGRPNV